MSGSGGVRWPAWTIVTILVVLIGSGITLLALCDADGSGTPQPTDFSKRTGLYAGQSVNKTFDVTADCSDVGPTARSSDLHAR
jgi:hypothetical protein